MKVEELMNTGRPCFINRQSICRVLGETMHSLSYGYLNINKPAVWVIRGMVFRWNVSSSKLLEMSRLQPQIMD
jgi:hypothetical protein